MESKIQHTTVPNTTTDKTTTQAAMESTSQPKSRSSSMTLAESEALEAELQAMFDDQEEEDSHLPSSDAPFTYDHEDGSATAQESEDDDDMRSLFGEDDDHATEDKALPTQHSSSPEAADTVLDPELQCLFDGPAAPKVAEKPTAPKLGLSLPPNKPKPCEPKPCEKKALPVAALGFPVQKSRGQATVANSSHIAKPAASESRDQQICPAANFAQKQSLLDTIVDLAGPMTMHSLERSAWTTFICDSSIRADRAALLREIMAALGVREVYGVKRKRDSVTDMEGEVEVTKRRRMVISQAENAARFGDVICL